METDRDVLSDDVKPSNYNISLFNLQRKAPWTYQGCVMIDLALKTPTRSLTVNTHELKIYDAELTLIVDQIASPSIGASNISYDKNNQRCMLNFDQEIPQAEKSVLSITFQGIMNDSMNGFYRSRYSPVIETAKDIAKDDEYHYMFSTQFQPSDARRAFPCFDEPNLKATFDFEIEVPEELKVLSNMPERQVKKSSNVGHKIVRFERTPIMSTYLMAWALGDFEYIEEHTKRKYRGESLPIRVYTTRGLEQQGKLALECACRIIDYFSELFCIDYPLPKVDLLAVHELLISLPLQGSYGAMENWGLITFRTTDLLFDQDTSDQKYRNRIVYVVAHELAHQWFGNLVTMDWWNELWLNEGFATWAGWYAVDHLHPDWNVWGQFVTQSMHMAFQLDGLRASHPIEVPVKNALEVNQIFDDISYLKGSSVIRMLVAHLGVDTFLKGVANYFEKHQYSNAKSSDLWSALSQISGQDVRAFMDRWILDVGFPVVTIVEQPGQLSVRQSRFLSGGNVEHGENQTIWWIPMELKTGFPATETRHEHLATREEIYLDVDTDFYKVNSDQSGFYRTNLSAQRLLSLGNALDKLSVQDKVGLIGDATALAISGDGTTAGVLAFLERFSSEDNYFVWSEIFSSLDKLRSIFSDNKELIGGLSKYTLKLVTNATDKIRWEFGPHDGYLEGQLRPLLLLHAGFVGHEAVVAEASKRFDAFASGDNKAIHPSLRSTVYKIGIKNGGKPAYDSVKNEYLATTSIDGREVALQSLGTVQTAELAQEYLQFGFSSKVPIQDVHSVGVSLANNAEVRDEVWKYTKANWDMVRERLGCKMVVLERFLRLCLQEFVSFEIESDINAFFETKDNTGYHRALAIIGDTIKSNARYRDSNAVTTREWLLDHGYLERQ